MKRCPTCNRSYTDPTLSFCTEDGTPLVPVASDRQTPVGGSPFPGQDKNAGNQPDDWNAIAYQPPGSYVPPGGGKKRRAWPWVLGIGGLLAIGVAGISIAAFLTLQGTKQGPDNNNQRQSVASSTPGGTSENVNTITNTNTNTNTNVSPNANTNSSSPNTNAVPGVIDSNKNDNANVDGEIPTAKDQVLAQLTELEHEWTVANLNADKKALARILADDYAGPNAEGTIQGKAEYIRNIKRDTTVERWDFQGLKVTLRGDRATLTGRLQLVIQARTLVFRFVDKFVWRDGRWQATGSEVTPVQAAQ
jgi:hypothetical protein